MGHPVSTVSPTNKLTPRPALLTVIFWLHPWHQDKVRSPGRHWRLPAIRTQVSSQPSPAAPAASILLRFGQESPCFLTVHCSSEHPCFCTCSSFYLEYLAPSGKSQTSPLLKAPAQLYLSSVGHSVNSPSELVSPWVLCLLPTTALTTV